MALPLTVVVAKVLGLYERDDLVIRKSTTDELPKLVNLATTVTLLIWLGRRYVAVGQPPTEALLALWVLLTATTCLFRVVARNLAARVSAVERCLLLGDANTFRHMRGEVQPHQDAPSWSTTCRLTRQSSTAARACTRSPAVTTCTGSSSPRTTPARTTRRSTSSARPRRRGFASACCRASSAPSGARSCSTTCGASPCSACRASACRARPARSSEPSISPARSRSRLLLAPVMLICAVLIKLDSRGPVFFRQTRVGRDGDHFSIFKFRTMVDGADAMKHELVRAQRGRRPLQDRRRPPHHPRRQVAAPQLPRRAASAASTCCAAR